MIWLFGWDRVAAHLPVCDRFYCGYWRKGNKKILSDVVEGCHIVTSLEGPSNLWSKSPNQRTKFKAGLGHLFLAASLFIGGTLDMDLYSHLEIERLQSTRLKPVRMFGPSSGLLGQFINLLKERWNHETPFLFDLYRSYIAIILFNMYMVCTQHIFIYGVITYVCV